MLGHHGGNLDAARRLFPNAPEPWVDLSTGVNPYAYPFEPPPDDAIRRLPEPAAIAGLEAAAAAFYGVPRGAAVVAAPGSQSVLQWLPQILPARRVGVLGFTYGEYAEVWRRAGAEIVVVERVADLAEFDVAVVCNPNNPDGRVVPARELRQLAHAFAARDATLVVDEAFMDFGPDETIAPQVADCGAIVLRSFGKAFGLAGLRLGFAVAAWDVAERLRAALGPWPIPGPAIPIALQAFNDAGWLALMKVRLEASAGRLTDLLARAGFEIVGGTPLFRLARGAHAAATFERLASHGILVRRFEAGADRLRFGIPADETAWSRLAAAFDETLHRQLFHTQMGRCAVAAPGGRPDGVAKADEQNGDAGQKTNDFRDSGAAVDPWPAV